MRYVFSFGLFWLMLNACSNGTAEIRQGDYVVKGDIRIDGKDTIFNGLISYYDTVGKLRSIVGFTNNLKHGIEEDYYPNGKMFRKKVNYFGYENGVISVYDTTGRRWQECYKYMGLQVGFIKDYKDDALSDFRFQNFEGMSVYRMWYDSAGNIIETGSVLNYITSYVMINGKLDISIFLYLIDPPQMDLKYVLYYVDTVSGSSSVVKFIRANENGSPFVEWIIEKPEANHKYLFRIEAKYPQKNNRIKNILSEKEGELKMPARN